MTRRQTELLDLAAQALERGEDPFATGFLQEHQVTLDECYDISDLLAVGARMVLAVGAH